MLLKSKTGSKDMYKLLNYEAVTPTSQIRYRNQGFAFNSKEWEKYYIVPFICVKDTTLIWFQYRIIHQILTTNTFLYKIKYIETNECTFCKNSPETLAHLFYNCNKVKDMWHAVANWVLNKKGIHMKLNKTVILFGLTDKTKDVFLNWLLINIKYYIYKTKIEKRELNIVAVKNTLQNKYEIEKCILFKTCRYEEYNAFWAPWKILFS
jgi:hypothetical protein